MSATRAPVPDWLGYRNIIVPPDVIPVRRVSPVPKRPRTPCHHRPEGSPICRAGDREWFSDQLFADGHTPDLRSACGTSFTLHASCLVGVLLVFAGQPDSSPTVRASTPLRMPVFVSVLGGANAISGSSGAPAAAKYAETAPPAREVRPFPVKRPQPKTKTTAPRVTGEIPAPSRAARVDLEPTISRSQIEEPAGPTDSGLTLLTAPGDGVAETGSASGDGTGNGAGNGDGRGHGTGDGNGHGDGIGSGSGLPPAAVGPYRLGQGIEPPRKITHVAPIYPAGALSSRALGTVVIEVIVGTDGAVHNPKVIHSIPLLDEAALTAVRQWRFAPSRLNGVAVAVIVTIVVQFAIH